MKHWPSCLIVGFLFCSSFLWSQLTNTIVGNGRDLGNGCFLVTPEALNQATGIWYDEPINLAQDFSVNFDLFFSNLDDFGADGMTFVLKDNPSPVIGRNGGNLAYGSIDNSLAVEFDIWFNGVNFDPLEDHIAIIKNGSLIHNPAHPEFVLPPVQASATSPNIEDGNFHNVVIEWDSTLQNLTVTFDCVQRISYSADIVSEIFSNNPIVFFGFTGSTGGNFVRQELCFNTVSFIDNVILEDKEICQGDTINDVDANLTNNPSITYSWSPTTGVSDPNIPNPTFSPTQDTTYTVSISNQCGTTFQESFDVEVNEPPHAGSLSGNDVLCVGETSQLVSNGDTGGRWTSNNPSVASVNMNGLVTGNSAGSSTITYTVTGSSACPLSFTNYDITVSDQANAGNISGNSIVCVNTSVQLTTNGDTGGTWTSSDNSIATVDPNTGLVTAIVPGGQVIITYSVGTSASCASDSSTFTINTIQNLNAGAISGISSLCQNEATQLVSNGDAGGTWASSNNSIATVDSTGFVQTLSDGLVEISYTVNENSPCQNSAIFRLTVKPQPNAGNLTLSNVLCGGDSETAVTNGDVGGIWSSSNSAVASIDSNTGFIMALSPGITTITYTVNGISPCQNNEVSTDIQVISESVNAGMISGNDNLCVNDSSQLTSNGVTGGTWSSSDSSIATVSQTGRVNGISEGSVTIRYTISGTPPCPDDFSEFTVGVANPPAIESLNIGTNSIEIIATGGTPPYEYSINGIDFQPDNIFNGLSPNNYTVFVRNQNGICSTSQQSTGIISIPNFISPNGDGINDTWQIDFISTFPDATVSLYDRYGKQILSPVLVSDLNFSGSYLGRSLPSATYWYILKLNNANATVFSGFLTIKNL